ncbi:RNA recognition motif 2-domain-containing protein [Mycena filopes]|nr:RNA recognition motif 2-domain-containing protein [Mycena filopes]
MSDPPAASTPSVNGPPRPDRKQPQKAHPPRLQHSPSMPNIWFPPHSGPIPPRLIEACGDLLKRSTTPAGDSNAPKAANDHDDAVATPQDAHAQTGGVAAEEPSWTPALVDPNSQAPPTGSIESSVSYNTGVDSAVGQLQRSPGEEEIGFTDPDTISTRFLLIRNVSRNVNSEVLQFAILRTLAASTTAVVPHTAPTTALVGPPTTQSSGSLAPTIDTIKGVLLRYHDSHGIAILAFYDVRQAKSGQALLSMPTTGPLAACVGEDAKFGGWLRLCLCHCQRSRRGSYSLTLFMSRSLDDLQMVGRSPFLAETQGSFLLAVEVDTGAPATGSGVENAKREINITTLLGVLKAYGAVRSFGLAQDNKQDSSRKVFCVEYYDVREAHSAARLHGQVLFGMRLSLLDSDPQFAQQASAKTVDSDSGIPFPDSHRPAVRFEPAGQKAQIRERFLFIDTAGKTRPRSASAGHKTLEVVVHSSIPPGAADSPPFFYTSPPTSPSNGIPRSPRTPDSHNRRASNHLFFDAVGRSGDTPELNAIMNARRTPSPWSELTTRRLVLQLRNTVIHQWIVSPSLTSTGCFAPPLSGSFPYGYHPPPTQLIAPGVGYPGPPSPLGYTYDYDPHAHAVMTMNMGNTFEQAMLLPTSPLNMYSGFPYPPPPPNEYWSGAQTPSPQHTAYFHYPPLPPDSPPLAKLPPPPHPPFSLSRPSSFSDVPGRASTTRCCSISWDTRTTVMIKNIPNKMSDKDLMAYIGAVCARKIDFLYLRMDFQNGCNVGYAFVNFINVQDLLRFAKAKLGEKWNMFSSEKVLQMSYANYQGKEALVEKFKNSYCASWMNAWPGKPKIFYSDGPEQGLPEPFPAPTHLRRKERSSYNRGPLYVPGMMSAQSSLSQNRRPQADEHRERATPSRGHTAERPRRFRDGDEHTVYSLAHGMASASLGKKPNKK